MSSASEELTAAVQAAVTREADEHRAEPGLALTEFLVLASAQGWNADGKPVAQVILIPSDAPVHRIVGLLVHAEERFRAEILSSYEEGDD
jgi:hypothetical protein